MQKRFLFALAFTGLAFLSQAQQKKEEAAKFTPPVIKPHAKKAKGSPAAKFTAQPKNTRKGEAVQFTPPVIVRDEKKKG